MKKFVLILSILLMVCNQRDGGPLSDQHLRTMSELDGLGKSIDSWADEHKRFSTFAEGFAVLGIKTAHPKDGWGSEFRYLPIVDGGEVKGYALYSIGPNKIDNAGMQDDIVWTR